MGSSNNKDEEYLRELARSLFVHLPDEIREFQTKRMSKDIDYLIKKGWLPEENREKELKSRLSQFEADTYFRPDPLVRIQETALSLMESDQEEAKYRNIPVGLLSTMTMNGFAIRTPFGGKAIALNCTLWLHLINLFYCFRAVCLRNSKKPIGSHHPDQTYFTNIYNMIKVINSNNTLLIMVEGGGEFIS